MPQQIKISEILEDLENGYTRTSTSKLYNAEIGCIQDKYNLSNYELEHLFKHPQLKGRKTKTPKTIGFEIVDDVTTDSPHQEEVAVNAEPEQADRFEGNIY